MRVQRGNRVGQSRRRRSAQSDAKQGIDDAVGLWVQVADGADWGRPRRFCAAAGRGGSGALAKADHLNRDALSAQVGRRNETITSVVARSARHGQAARVRPQRPGQARCAGAGMRHQAPIRVRALKLAKAAAAEERCAANRVEWLEHLVKPAILDGLWAAQAVRGSIESKPSKRWP
jgi:hypothetical protein